MEYNKVVRAEFISRPNRFIANVLLSGEKIVCHVKNTGRCRELLVEGAEVFLAESGNPSRKTAYDLIAVNKNGLLINIDSQAPNKAAQEFLPSLFKGYDIFPERSFGSSRFDFYAEKENSKAFIEVKGVTLERDGVAMFPDAPTERGLKHLKELIAAVGQGFDAMILFVLQMKGMKYFTPNYETHREFGEMLQKASESGVRLLAVECEVTPLSMDIAGQIPIIF
ncbi:MAG: DNA/RNA nuclease SfsA [Clostridiales bacterium]|nr:DNA/RNA nuclease SfsA [Clostridiales bacterium]